MYRTPAFLAFAFLATTASAQELAPLHDLAACRLAGDKVAVSFSYDGGACEKTAAPKADIAAGQNATVSVAIVPTADVCTMNVVPVESTGTVSVPGDITHLTVQLVSPGSEVQAQGQTKIGTTNCADKNG